MTAPPVVQGFSGATADAGPFFLTPPIVAKDDCGILYVQSANQDAFLSVPAGFSIILGSTAGIGTLSATVARVAGAAFNEANPTTGGTVTIPASVVSGHDLFLHLNSRNHNSGTAYPTVTDNDGGTWTRIHETSTRQGTIWHRKATSATASKTITVAGCVSQCAATLEVYSGGDTVPYTNFSVEDNAAGDESHAGFTPSAADSMVVVSIFYMGDDHTTTNFEASNPATLTKRTENVNTGCAVVTASAKQTGAAAATGTFTWEPDSAATSKSIVYAIKPAAANPATRVTMFGRRFDSATPPTPWIGDSGDHQLAFMLTFRGCVRKGNFWDVFSAPQTLAAPDTAVSIPGLTTNFDQCLIAAAVAHAIDSTTAQASGWTNASLASAPVEQADVATNVGAGGGIAVATGVKTVKGLVSATTATLASSSIQAKVAIALRPHVPPAGDTTFLSITDPDDNSTIALNVLAFREEPMDFRGSLRPAFDGTLRSTLRGPKRRFTATVDLLSVTEVEALRAFVRLPTGPGPRVLYMVSKLNGALRGAEPILVYVEVGPSVPTDHELAAGTYVQTYETDLTFREI